MGTGPTVNSVLTRLIRALRRDQEPDTPVEMLDAAMLRSRIGEPLAPKDTRRGTAPARADARLKGRERSWRRTAGLTK